MVLIRAGGESLDAVCDTIGVDEPERRAVRESGVDRRSSCRPVQHGRERPETHWLALVFPAGTPPPDRHVKRPLRFGVVIDGIESDTVAATGLPAADRPVAGAPLAGPVAVFEFARAPGLVDGRVVLLALGKRARLGGDRFDVGGVGRFVSGADRDEFERGLLGGIDADQLRDGVVREPEDDLGAHIERVSDREQVRKRRPRVPERVAEGPLAVLPGVAPPRRGRHDRDRSLGDRIGATGGGEGAPVIALAEDVQREATGLEMVDARVEIGAIAGHEIQIDMIQRAGRRGRPKQQIAVAPPDSLGDSRRIVTQLCQRFEIHSSAAVVAIGIRFGDRRECR